MAVDLALHARPVVMIGQVVSNSGDIAHRRAINKVCWITSTRKSGQGGWESCFFDKDGVDIDYEEAWTLAEPRFECLGVG